MYIYRCQEKEGNAYLWYAYGADDVSPAAVRRLFQGSTFAETETAFDIIVVVALTPTTLPIQQWKRLRNAIALGVYANTAFRTAK